MSFHWLLLVPLPIVYFLLWIWFSPKRGQPLPPLCVQPKKRRRGRVVKIPLEVEIHDVVSKAPNTFRQQCLQGDGCSTYGIPFGISRGRFGAVVIHYHGKNLLRRWPVPMQQRLFQALTCRPDHTDYNCHEFVLDVVGEEHPHPKPACGILRFGDGDAEKIIWSTTEVHSTQYTQWNFKPGQPLVMWGEKTKPKENIKFHCALYLGDGFFLSKLGQLAWVSVGTLQSLIDVYQPKHIATVQLIRKI